MDEVHGAHPAAARRADHPRDHADLRHPRARLQLDAGRREGRRREPAARRRGSSTSTPASRTTTCAPTTSTSGSRSPRRPTPKLGLDGTLEVLQELTGAESMRQLPDPDDVQDQHEPRDGGRHRRARRARSRRRRRASSRPQPYDDFDVAVIRALQGPMEVADRPYDAAAAEARDDRSSGLLEHLRGMVERKLLRRVAAILFHRRAGFSANGMGVWKVPEDEIAEIGPPDGRGARRSPTATSARPIPDWPYSVFTMAHGRSKEECDAVLDCVADECGLARRRPRRRSTPRPSTRRSGCTTSPPTTPSWEQRARRSLSCRSPRLGTSARGALRSAPRADPRRGEQPGAGDARDRPRADLHRARRGLRARSTSTATATSTRSAPGAR